MFYSPNEANYLNIVSAPGEIDYKLFNMPLRTYWDFNWNVTAQRACSGRLPGVQVALLPLMVVLIDNAAVSGWGNNPTGVPATPANIAAIRSSEPRPGDGLAWGIGEQIGQNKKKGDWSLLGEFRQVGLGSVDPNINGTDFANSFANQQGFKLKGVYNFTDYLTLGVTYYNTWDYKDNLFNAINGGNAKPISGTSQYLVAQSSMQRVQVDIGWKF